MKTLRAHGFNQRPRFEQVVGYLERNEPLPLDQPDRKATPSARRGRRTASSQMQLGSLQYPHNPMKEASEHFHFPLRPRGYLRRHGAQHRHRPRGQPAPQLHCRLSHRARAQDAAEWCQHPLGRPCPVHLQGPGRTTDLFIHLVTLSGTGVSKAAKKRPGVPLHHF